MHVCPNPDCCSEEMLQDMRWEAEPDNQWYAELFCGGCGTSFEGVFSEAQVEIFSRVFARHMKSLTDGLHVLKQENMCDYAARFIDALAIDAIKPEDF